MLYDSQRLGLPNREETIKAPILADGSLNKIILNLWSKNLYLKIFQIRFYLSICTALHPHGPLTTLSDFRI